ncbi:DUF2567 domain-containing protein [Nocardia veterana]|uniref:DUF2567 domain-containing protein n=1 Tax=Nocardia veterana TaxID=132249 RepID=A0A7X6LX25_9NOCA|nr:DUF2567 domain-containing protein [Nocardia veterana]NKY86220.1 DUF2567 domain-containing protein [Nocardia veterana]
MALRAAAVPPGGAAPVSTLRRELRAALWILAAVLVVGLIGGGVWALLAPTEKVLVVEPGSGLAMTGESAHRFDAVAIFACAGVVAGVLSAAAVWRWRSVRGPIMLGGLLLGSLAGAWVMSWSGEHVARWIHPRAHNPPVHTVVDLAPTVEGWTVLLVQPLAAGLVVLLLSALSTSEDLGRDSAEPLGSAPRPPLSDVSYGPYHGPGSYRGANTPR